ncbi:MAG TPA: UDP-N-acetylglucosamine 2-epimerase, partial [Thermoplasmata archaeon]|nr:UDP-N-acetylglucosamine 2-epimerase [Thermoplasmata archaeon]
FAPTRTAVENLVREGIGRRRIHLTGNTSADALSENLGRVDQLAALARFGLQRDGYIIMTLHRQENVDSERSLRAVLRGVGMVARRSRLPVLWPIHPRTVKMLKRFRLRPPPGVRTVPPIGYFEFLALEKNARLVLTDSGGIQEEACILGVPCVTIWESETCWIETVRVGANRRVAPQADAILAGASGMMRSDRAWANPYGRGGASARIVRTLLREAGRE